MTTPPGLAIVIATRHREQLLARTLESVAGSKLPAALTEVVVIENGGETASRTIVEAMSGRLPVRYMSTPEGNKSRALNAALRDAAADMICFLDDDVRIDHQTIDGYAAGATKYGRGHYFSGPLVAEWELEPQEWLKPYLPPSAKGWDLGDHEVYVDRAVFIGSNWAAFRDDLLSAGGFDEHIGPGTPAGAIGDETELQQRMLRAGNRGVYLPHARIWHHVARSSCDFEWARLRQRRTGVTSGLLGTPPYWRSVPRGPAGLALIGVLFAKVAVARALGWSEERRVHVEMVSAYVSGYVKGRRLAAHRKPRG